jgi:hypothetical protein
MASDAAANAAPFVFIAAIGLQERCVTGLRRTDEARETSEFIRSLASR